METLKQSIGVFIGGGIGACLRYLIATSVQSRNPSEFPWGTFAVNVSGAFVVGLLMTVFVDHFEINPFWRFFLIVGILGGYTTFSALSWEAYELFSLGSYLHCAMYTLGSLIVGGLAVGAGAWVGQFFRL